MSTMLTDDRCQRFADYVVNNNTWISAATFQYRFRRKVLISTAQNRFMVVLMMTLTRHIRIHLCADIRSGSLKEDVKGEWGRALTLVLNTLFLAFEDYCVKVNIDRPML